MSVPSKVYLTKRSNGFYYIVYWVEGRRRWKTTHTRTKREALHALHDLERLLNDRLPEKPFSEFAGEFLQYASSLTCPPYSDPFCILETDRRRT